MLIVALKMFAFWIWNPLISYAYIQNAENLTKVVHAKLKDGFSLKSRRLPEAS